METVSNVFVVRDNGGAFTSNEFRDYCSKNCEAMSNELIEEAWLCSTALKESVTELVDTKPSRFGRMWLAQPISAKVDSSICDKNSL